MSAPENILAVTDGAKGLPTGTDPLEWALYYASLGLCVHPLWWIEDSACACPKGDACPRSGKHPILKEWQSKASIKREDICSWWDQWPLAHVGIATGARSGIIVIDLDKKPGKDGLASLKALGSIPRTAIARTGTGGLHIFLRHPGGHVSNSAGKLGAGIDVRGDGGYVVAAPSRHISGGVYEWVKS